MAVLEHRRKELSKCKLTLNLIWLGKRRPPRLLPHCTTPGLGATSRVYYPVAQRYVNSNAFT